MCDRVKLDNQPSSHAMTDPTQIRRLAAILAADAAGYSRLMQDDEAATIQTLGEYRRVFADHIDRHRGHVVDTAGDSVLATFESPVEAVECAVEIQRELARRNRNFAEHRRMVFRIGINLGDIITREDGTVYGDGVNIAARLERLCEPGGVTVSGTVFDHVENKLPLSFEFAGEQSVKNIAKPVRAYRLGPSSTGLPPVTAPSAGTARGAMLRKWAVLGGLLLVIAVVVAGWQASRVGEGALSRGEPVVAVLAFANMSGDSKQEYFSDGLTETIIDNLTQVPGIKVIARNSSFRYKGRAVDIRKVGEELGADFVVEGSVRRSAGAVRITAQLIDPRSDAHLWSKTYDRALTAENVFAIQDDIAAAIVGTIAGAFGVLTQTALEEIKRKPPRDLNSYDCVLLSLAYRQALSLQTFRVARDCAQQAIKVDPDYAQLWLALSSLARGEFQFDYDLRPGSLDRALEAGQRAVALDPTLPGPHLSLAITHFYRGELDEFKFEADRELALAPRGTADMGGLGLYWVYAGEWEKGLAMIERAKERDPFYPLWYHNGQFHDLYRKKEYAKAATVARQMNLTDFVQAQSQLVAAYGQLGRVSEAQPYIKRIYELDPAFDARKHWEARFRYQPEYLEHLLDGMRKAGMKIS